MGKGNGLSFCWENLYLILECWLESWLFHFQSSILLICPMKQWMMVQILGSLHLHGRPNGNFGFQLQPGSALTVAGIWKVFLYIEDLFFLFLLFCLSNDENKQISVFSGTMGGIIRSLEKNLKIMWFNTALYQLTPNNFYFLLIYTQIKDFHNLLHFGKKQFRWLRSCHSTQFD